MIRVGVGLDAHAFEPGRKLVLGGVEWPDETGLGGHSDGDVVCHAVADALLGAAGLGDIGDHFPPTERWRDVSGTEILEHTRRLLVDADVKLGNVDVTVIAARPRIAERRSAMANNIAGALGPTVTVSVKATTTDEMGFTGRGEGIAAIAVAGVEADSNS